MKVNGKKILVTGGGNGVGRELVLQLLEKGATVLAIDINESGLKETKEKAGNANKLFTYVVDISDQVAVHKMSECVIEEHQYIDGIINNAGVIQPFLPTLLNRAEAHILNVSSMGGFLPVPGQSAYGASKAAVKLLTEGLASELKGTGVKVSVVIPGGIATDIKKNSQVASKVTKENQDTSLLLTPQKAAMLMIKLRYHNFCNI